MTGDELIAEGQRLAKPCVYLEAEPTTDRTVVAVWGCDGVVAPPAGPYKHWLSVSGASLPASIGSIRGVLSIYTNEDDCELGVVAIDAGAHIGPPHGEGRALYPRPALSLPPIDAVFKYGSPAVQEWLVENDWLPGRGEDEAEYAYNDNFPDRAVAEMYLQAWQEQLPLYTGTAYAVLGGWHMPWPDGDWYDLLDQTLVAWTFEDAEPWVEVWRDASGEYTVLQRVT